MKRMNGSKKIAALLALCCAGSAAAGATLLGGNTAFAAEFYISLVYNHYAVTVTADDLLDLVY